MKREPKEKIEAITFQLQRHKIEQLQTLCKQLAEALSAVTWLLHRRSLDPQEVGILVKSESALESAKKSKVIE